MSTDVVEVLAMQMQKKAFMYKNVCKYNSLVKSSLENSTVHFNTPCGLRIVLILGPRVKTGFLLETFD